MIGPLEIGAVLLMLLAVWLVWDTLRSREYANAAMRSACELRGLFFLDDTVSLHSVRLVRDDDGRIKVRRIYHFQYSDTGHNRRDGSITLVTDRVTSLDIDDEPQHFRIP